jgi:RNA-directed DNA polymerase
MRERCCFVSPNQCTRIRCLHSYFFPQAAIPYMKPQTALENISDLKSLRHAWKRLKKRKKSRGSDGVTIEGFGADLDTNLRGISSKLRDGSYRLHPLRPSVLKKLGASKPRPLQVPAVRDRVVMKALALFIQPSFSQLDLPCSFAYISGSDRGVSAVIRRVHELVALGYVHYFEADIISFFGAVDRNRLWKMFSKKIRHRSLVPLLKQCFDQELDNLEAFQLEYEELFVGATSGIPQGGVLSPMLANFYLHEFDRTVTGQGFELIRYADDFVVMCKTPAEAQRAHTLCQTILEGLGLQIHALGAEKSKTRFGYYSKEGLNFVGVRFEGKITTPDPRKIPTFKAKVSLLLKPHAGESLVQTLQSLKNLIKGWGHGYKAMRVQKTFAELDSFVRDEVAKYLKASGIKLEGKNRAKQMRFLGVPSLSAMLEHTPKPVSNGQDSNALQP